MKFTKRAATLLLCALAATGTTVAHHSPAAYDLERKSEVTGVIKFAEFRNPHSRLILLVRSAEGVEEEWTIEASAANLLARRGWKFKEIKVGDTVTCIGFPAKTRPREIYMKEIRLPNGEVFGDSRAFEGYSKALD